MKVKAVSLLFLQFLVLLVSIFLCALYVALIVPLLQGFSFSVSGMKTAWGASREESLYMV